MNLLVVADGHYFRTPSGKVYAESVYNYSFYARYLAVFDRVFAVVRTELVDENNVRGNLCSGENVLFLELPPFRGPWEYITKFFEVRRLSKEYAKQFDCAIFRLPSATGNLLCSLFSKTGKPFAVEVVVDPYENFAPGVVKSILRPIIRYHWTKLLRRMCLRANGVSYVTESYLQSRYPSRARVFGCSDCFESFYSSVELPDNAFNETREYFPKSHYSIIHVSNYFSGYGKGHIPLMRAVKKVILDGFDVDLTFIGDGPLKEEFQKESERLGISSCVYFAGRLINSLAVKDAIRQADLFVFPTQAEGLPRVLLEAMSEGLPCISSPTCGIPEVLSPDFLVDYYDIDRLASTIELLLTNPSIMESEGRKNLLTSKKYKASVLTERRNMFYNQLRQAATDYQRIHE